MRIHTFFPRSAQGSESTLLAAVQGSKYTVDAYTDAFNHIVSMCFDTAEPQFFTLPKLMPLLGMLIHQPWLVASVLLATDVLDLGRSHGMAALTKRIGSMAERRQELANNMVEQHDVKHEELIRRGGMNELVERRWNEIADFLDDLTIRYHALVSLRAFMNWLYKQDLLLPGIELVLAFPFESGHIPTLRHQLKCRAIETSPVARMIAVAGSSTCHLLGRGKYIERWPRCFLALRCCCPLWV